MSAKWSRKRVLITVRTYPVPAKSGVEVSCTAGVTDDGQWIRLFPIPYRFLDEDKRFSKYQWIDVDVTRPRDDPRPESHKLNAETISIVNSGSTERAWRERKDRLRHLIRPSLCEIRRELDANGHPTLGLFKPAQIKRLMIEAENPEWSPQQQVYLQQNHLFEKGPAKPLEKIPYKFSYEFRCNDPDCKGHTMSCTDWEMGQSYRRWRRDYVDDWERVFRQKYEREMIERFDTHFYVGTIHQHPKSWIIIGLFYPPHEAMPDLFS